VPATSRCYFRHRCAERPKVRNYAFSQTAL
jgi:hypothetical protein